MEIDYKEIIKIVAKIYSVNSFMFMEDKRVLFIKEATASGENRIADVIVRLIADNKCGKSTKFCFEAIKNISFKPNADWNAATLIEFDDFEESVESEIGVGGIITMIFTHSDEGDIPVEEFLSITDSLMKINRVNHITSQQRDSTLQKGEIKIVCIALSSLELNDLLKWY